MGKLFDNKFIDGINKIADVFILCFFFLVCSIPVFTMGASMTAMYYTMHKCIFKNRGYTTDFFRSFKENFRQATVSWVVFLVLFTILTGDIYIMRNFVKPDSPFAAASIFFTVLLVFTIVWMTYHFAYIARFENGIKASFKISAIFLVANIGWSLLIAVIIGIVLYLTYRFVFLVIFLPVILPGVLHPILEKVFRKYMSPEDLAKEDEQ
ncbi:MAG: YesL family protein [Pseudobutyrivibrio sp.]|nr:YesL family protein [Pseudobutyrivibrio sp.]